MQIDLDDTEFVDLLDSMPIEDQQISLEVEWIKEENEFATIWYGYRHTDDALIIHLYPPTADDSEITQGVRSGQWDPEKNVDVVLTEVLEEQFSECLYKGSYVADRESFFISIHFPEHSLAEHEVAGELFWQEMTEKLRGRDAS